MRPRQVVKTTADPLNLPGFHQPVQGHPYGGPAPQVEELLGQKHTSWLASSNAAQDALIDGLYGNGSFQGVTNTRLFLLQQFRQNRKPFIWDSFP
jgi:hypothetical protein